MAELQALQPVVQAGPGRQRVGQAPRKTRVHQHCDYGMQPVRESVHVDLEAVHSTGDVTAIKFQV